MCLRTLLRQLLAGTGWIMDSSMSKDHATQLIRQLIGPSLDKKCLIQLSPEQAEAMSSDIKELHYSKLLAGILQKNLDQSPFLSFISPLNHMIQQGTEIELQNQRQCSIKCSLLLFSCADGCFHISGMKNNGWHCLRRFDKHVYWNSNFIRDLTAPHQEG